MLIFLYLQMSRRYLFAPDRAGVGREKMPVYGLALYVIAGLDPAIHAAGMSGYWLYVMVNASNGTLYVGVTNNLVRRVFEHREGLIEGFHISRDSAGKEH